MPGRPSASARLMNAMRRVGAAALLLGAAGGEDHRALGVGELPHGRRAGRATEMPVSRSTRSGQNAATLRRDRVEAGGARGDVVLVDEALADREVQQAVGERDVGAGPDLQVPVRALRRRGAARVDDDVRAPRARGPRRRTASPAASCRPGCCRPAAPRRPAATSASGNGRPRSMPKALLAAVAAERHAEAAVVVDLRGAQRDPGELAELVGLLVGQPAAAEAADRVAAVRPAGWR